MQLPITDDRKQQQNKIRNCVDHTGGDVDTVHIDASPRDGRVPEFGSGNAFKDRCEKDCCVEQHIKPYHEMTLVIGSACTGWCEYVQQLYQDGKLGNQHDWAVNNVQIIDALRKSAVRYYEKGLEALPVGTS